MSIRANDNILWLYIPVNNATAVTISQRIQQLSSPSQCLILWNSTPALNVLRQAMSADKIHHQIGITAFLKEIGNSHQIRVL
ncbi:MAG: hypothetical protein BWY63_02144 [Chloroflexi bacterium ADurb.Bin360]|nr:MAG: hypothetical protein BWY63_02144 [Chloroflexi bacterium ADurb.Bin360]